MMYNWRPTERLDTILDRSIDRLDEDTPENIARNYPQSAGQLMPLLHVANALRELEYVKMPLAAKQAGRARLRQVVLAQQRRRNRRIHRAGSLRMAAWAVLFLAISIGSVSSITRVSAGALPDEPLYRWKRASERVWLRLQPTPEREIAVALALADRRVDETRQLYQRSGQVRGDVITQLRADYSRVMDLIATLPDAQAQLLLAKAQVLSAQHEQQLTILAQQTTGSEQQMLLSAVEASQQVQEVTPRPGESIPGAAPATSQPGSPAATPQPPAPSATPHVPPVSNQPALGKPSSPPGLSKPPQPAAPGPSTAPGQASPPAVSKPPQQPGPGNPPARPSAQPEPPRAQPTAAPVQPEPTPRREPPRAQPTAAPVQPEPTPRNEPPRNDNPPGPPSDPPGQGQPPQPPGPPDNPPGNDKPPEQPGNPPGKVKK